MLEDKRNNVTSMDISDRVPIDHMDVSNKSNMNLSDRGAADLDKSISFRSIADVAAATTTDVDKNSKSYTDIADRALDKSSDGTANMGISSRVAASFRELETSWKETGAVRVAVQPQTKKSPTVADVHQEDSRDGVQPLPPQPVGASQPGAYAHRSPRRLIVNPRTAAASTSSPSSPSTPPVVPDSTAPSDDDDASDCESGLARARPVLEEQQKEGMEAAQPVDLEAHSARKKARRENHKMFVYASITLVLFVAIAIALSIGLAVKKKKDNYSTSDSMASLSSLQTKSPSLAPSEYPSAAPTSSLDVLLSNLPNTTQTSLLDPFSPQSKALHWLRDHPDRFHLTERRKTQLFALATVYYAWDGPNWPNGLNEDWLDDTRSECLWYSSTGLNWGLITNEFYGNQGTDSCNEAGDFQILSLDGALDLGGHKREFPYEISLLTSLKVINLNGVGLNTSFSEEIWPVVSALSNLETLELVHNRITGTIPTQLASASSLTNLEVTMNHLSGSVPTQLALMSGLKRLAIAANHLKGTIPSQLGQLTALEELSLQHCDFAGQIPSQLGLATNLRELELWSSSLTGLIPSQIGRLTLLNVLGVKNNALEGPIPSELGLLTSLDRLFMESNSLTGTIPSQLNLLTALKSLNLDQNQLSGSVPSQLGTFTNLVYLSLHHNSLLGRIPSQLGLLPAVFRISLGDNLLSGPIPSELGTPATLQELYLNGNQLTGTIPSAWASLQFNSSSTKGDEFDTSLSPFEQGYYQADFLHKLDLSDNPLLTGTVPDDLCRMNTSSCTVFEWNWGTFSWDTPNCTLQFDCDPDRLCGCDNYCPCSSGNESDGEGL